MSDDKIEVEGSVVELLPGTEFKVKLDNSDKVIRCVISGKIRQSKIKIILLDRVTVKLSPYNLDLGTIVYRHK